MTGANCRSTTVPRRSETPTGRILGVVLVFRDVEPQRAEAAARQQAEAERERLLAAERAARAEAERASRIKDEFVAMVSHELRTPLNAILGWTQLMARSPGDLELLERGLDVVARNTRVQAQLVSDLLDISRIVEGKLHARIAAAWTSARWSDEAIDTVAPEAAAKRSSRCAPISPSARVRRRRSRAAAADRLEPVVQRDQVHPRPRRDHRRRCGAPRATSEIAVADSGAGIRPDVLPYIFDRFHQADRSITRRFGGLGLGLAIVKHLVELHGGRVLRRQRRRGTGGHLHRSRCPRASRPTPWPMGRDPRRPPSPQRAVTLEAVRVLVVEDEPDTRQFLKRLLERHGARVVTAASGRDALDAFRRDDVDVLISDIGLPGLDGYELMRQIRRGAPAGRRVAAIALTAYARAEDRTRALRAGYQAHVTKPVDGAELVAMVASLLDLTTAARRSGEEGLAGR